MPKRQKSLMSARLILREQLRERGHEALADRVYLAGFWGNSPMQDIPRYPFRSERIGVGAERFLLVSSDLTGLHAADDQDFLVAVYPGTEILDAEDALVLVASDDDHWFEQ